MLVIAPDADEAIPVLLQEGRVMAGSVILHQMEASRCHDNVARLWLEGFEGLNGVCIGYALSDDGLWRQHCWGLVRGGILETTVLRDVYFGIALPPEITDSLACHILEGS
jgi:hypothetical protein